MRVVVVLGIMFLCAMSDAVDVVLYVPRAIVRTRHTAARLWNRTILFLSTPTEIPWEVIAGGEEYSF